MAVAALSRLPTGGSPRASGGRELVPVGTIHLSTDATNPAAGFGYGSWVRLGQGRVLVGVDEGDPDFASAATGGSKTHTPAGTVSAPAFSGEALGTHTHELPFHKAAGGTGAWRAVASSVFGTGTSRAAESASVCLGDTTSAPVALSQAVSAGVPAGTCSAPAFSGTPGNTMPPFLAVYFWVRTA